MKYIDLSLTLESNLSEPVPVNIDYISHAQGAELLGKEKGLTTLDFPDELGLSIEYVSLSTHSGTHIDAPLHYGPICEGVVSKSISELPLSWFYSDGVLLRLSDDLALGDISLSEVKNKLSMMGYTIKPFDIILIQTKGDSNWGNPKYFTDFRGMSVEATEWLIDQGVKIIGVDTFGFDPPFHIMLDRYVNTRDKKYLWPAHMLGRTREYCQIERLTNLSAIPLEFGFKVICFPIKAKQCGAGWSRVVAIVS